MDPAALDLQLGVATTRADRGRLVGWEELDKADTRQIGSTPQRPLWSWM
jgi:hypothetical protein